MKTKIILSAILIFLFSSCSSQHYVRKSSIVSLTSGNPLDWDLTRCDKILDLYTINNQSNKLFQSGNIQQNIYIKAYPLNINTIQALSRKEVIQKRLKKEEYYDILKFYLNQFTDMKYDPRTKTIIESKDSLRGYSFKVYFENISSPYTPIFLEDGYSYFFLENSNGDFSRVTNVSGLFVEEFFRVDDFLDAVITFSATTDEGKRLFNSPNLEESYSLIFNGISRVPIKIGWRSK